MSSQLALAGLSPGAAKAVDSNTSQSFGGNSCSHSAFEAQPWW